MREFIALYLVVGVLHARVYCWEIGAAKENELGLVKTFFVQTSIWPLLALLA
jgi:hypothetical protein